MLVQCMCRYPSIRALVALQCTFSKGFFGRLKSMYIAVALYFDGHVAVIVTTTNNIIITIILAPCAAALYTIYRVNANYDGKGSNSSSSSKTCLCS